ncbi:hypothetical protein [Nesterenkonia sp. NBAIMH1]|uniref:hypothetical protein n=1 Tax=Nesterenkonia sp. NBAIMH1 TaxID=2600320 RepID=UPI0011B7F8C3|nr:hypothetical protein [Nesterenkonia sp. NBAIMH1]
MRSETEPPPLLLVTADERLRDDIALIAAVVGASLEVHALWRDAADSASDRWAARLCGPDAPPPAGISDVLLAGPDSEALWAAAALAPHASPVPLPAGEAWLSEHLSAKVLNRSEGTVISVAGAVGGSGATTIAYLLAAEAAVRGDRVLLLDGDAGFGSGLHHVNERAHTVSGAAAGGLALPELIAAEGRSQRRTSPEPCRWSTASICSPAGPRRTLISSDHAWAASFGREPAPSTQSSWTSAAARCRRPSPSGLIRSSWWPGPRLAPQRPRAVSSSPSRPSPWP